MSLRQQGANKGAVTSFLISTPESGVDPIAITYALLDPILTVMRPVVAFFTAFTAGVFENLTGSEKAASQPPSNFACPVDGCCDGVDCPAELHRRHHTFGEKLFAGLRYAFTEFWEDLAGAFFFGLLLAGIISALIPPSFLADHLGGGLRAMLIMLAAGIPLYICATASTPIAAALIIKGVSPGAALVFLLAGPATNVAALTVLVRTLGKRSTAVFLATIAACAVMSGLMVDRLYEALGISAKAVVGEATEAVPPWLALVGAMVLICISLRPLAKIGKKCWGRFTAMLAGKAVPRGQPIEPTACEAALSNCKSA